MNTKKYFLSAAAAFISAVMMLNTAGVSADDATQNEEYADYTETIVTLSDAGYSAATVMSNADSGFLFYDQLDTNNKNSYELFEEYLASPSDTSFTVALEEDVVVGCSSRSMSNWSEEEYNNYANAILGAVMPGVIACTLDYPELFWLNFAEVGCGLGSSGFSYESGTDTKWNMIISKVVITPNHDTNYSDFNEVMEIREAVLQAAEDYAVEGETDYEKCVSIYESIISSTTYDTSAPYAHGIAGVLYDTNAVCEGFAKTFKYLCDREGIPCITVLGNYNEEALTAHMWNYVYLDGEWYGCDPTFDDSAAGKTYFMRGSDSFSTSHRPESPYSIMTLTFPEISSDDYVPEDAEITTTTTATTTSTTTTTTTTATTTTETSEFTETTSSTTEETTTDTETTTVTETTTASLETTATITTTTTETASEVTTSDTTTSVTETTMASSTTETTLETTVTSEPDVIYGDTNDDGELTVADIIRLKKFLIKAEKIKLSETFDFNQDGLVNIFDASALMKLLISI